MRGGSVATRLLPSSGVVLLWCGTVLHMTRSRAELGAPRQSHGVDCCQRAVSQARTHVLDCVHDNVLAASPKARQGFFLVRPTTARVF